MTPVATATNSPGSPITVGRAPREIAITPNGATAYVTNFDDNTVTPITTATNTPGSPIAVGPTPIGIAITPDAATAYVANYGGSTVTPIATATNTAGAPITVGGVPIHIAIAPNGVTAYVNNFMDNTVTPIATATNTAGAPIAVGSHPEGIAITPDQAPIAHFSVVPASHGSATQFNGSASTGTTGPIARYAWKFGDGMSRSTTSPTISHTYAAGGAYTVTLTVTDSAGTSTRRVFTGQTMSRNGGRPAMATKKVSIT